MEVRSRKVCWITLGERSSVRAPYADTEQSSLIYGTRSKCPMMSTFSSSLPARVSRRLLARASCRRDPLVRRRARSLHRDSARFA